MATEAYLSFALSAALGLAGNSESVWRWRRRRGLHTSARVSSYVALGWQTGVLLAAMTTPVLLPFIGWRGMFAVGVFPAIASFLLRRVTEEPEIFVQHAAAARSTIPLKLLVKDAATMRVSVSVWILCSVQNFGYFGLMIWLPTYLSTQLNYGLTESSLWTVSTIPGMACGIWVCSVNSPTALGGDRHLYVSKWGGNHGGNL